jgi:hypothetical protein
MTRTLMPKNRKYMQKTLCFLRTSAIGYRALTNRVEVVFMIKNIPIPLFETLTFLLFIAILAISG